MQKKNQIKWVKIKNTFLYIKTCSYIEGQPQTFSHEYSSLDKAHELGYIFNVGKVHSCLKPYPIIASRACFHLYVTMRFFFFDLIYFAQSPQKLSRTTWNLFQKGLPNSDPLPVSCRSMIGLNKNIVDGKHVTTRIESKGTELKSFPGSLFHCSLPSDIAVTVITVQTAWTCPSRLAELSKEEVELSGMFQKCSSSFYRLRLPRSRPFTGNSRP